jgi:hypothetical protein
MTYNPVIYHRRSIRLKGYDYSRAGLYYLTVCTKNRQCLFGQIANGQMVLNDAGGWLNAGIMNWQTNITILNVENISSCPTISILSFKTA